MKKIFAFSIVWTIGTALGVIAMWNDPEFGGNPPMVRWILTGLPVFGIWFVWWSWRRLLRYRSVHTVQTEDGVIFVWTELDGSLREDTVDPRTEWDKVDNMESNT